MRCSGCLQPKATRCRTRSFVFVLSVSALERSCTMAASMPARFFLILRPSSTKAGIRQRCAHSSQASRMVGESTPLVRQESPKCRAVPTTTTPTTRARRRLGGRDR